MQELPADLRPVTVEDAYAVQDALHECLAARGAGAMAGHKVGCTTPVMQAYLGIDHPCAGGVPAATAQHGHGAFRFADFVRVGVECEIAVRLGRDLTGAVDRDAAASAVDAVMAAIEIVDDRWQDYATVTPPTLIADDFFAAGCVLGDGREPGMDLRTVRGAMTVNGETVGEGTGADILGHPLNTLVWLAGTRAAARRRVRAAGQHGEDAVAERRRPRGGGHRGPGSRQRGVRVNAPAFARHAASAPCRARPARDRARGRELNRRCGSCGVPLPPARDEGQGRAEAGRCLQAEASPWRGSEPLSGTNIERTTGGARSNRVAGGSHGRRNDSTPPDSRMTIQ